MPFATARAPWIVTPNPNPAARLRLLCFPHAGAGISAFVGWPPLLPADVELRVIQMPGRETRLNEPAVTWWEEAIELVVESLRPRWHEPFAVYGHSLGAILAFELARRLRRERAPAPLHVFVSGRRAPHLPPLDRVLHTLPDEAFVTELRRLTGTPEDVLQSPEMRAIFLPLLRADLTLAETYVYRNEAPLSIPISAYGGDTDPDVPPPAMAAWRLQTASAFRNAIFPGGHFYVNERRAAVLAELSRELRAIP